MVCEMITDTLLTDVRGLREFEKDASFIIKVSFPQYTLFYALDCRVGT